MDNEDYEIGVDSWHLPRVVCRQLGYQGGLQQHFDPVPPLNATELAGNLICTGSEASVSDCEFNSGEVVGSQAAARGCCLEELLPSQHGACQRRTASANACTVGLTLVEGLSVSGV